MNAAQFSGPELDRARAHLEKLGYRIQVRELEWFECRVSSQDEDWLARGTDANDAFAHALGLLFPSRAARLALTEQLRERSAGEPTIERPLPTVALARATRLENAEHPGEADRDDDSASDDDSVGASDDDSASASDDDSASDDEATRIADVTRIDEPARVADVTRLDITLDATTLEICIPIDEDDTRPPTPHGDVLRELEQLRARVLGAGPTLATLPRPLQRLHIVRAAAVARAFEDLAPRSPEIRHAADAVIGMLRRMAESFKSGELSTLSVAVHPNDCAADLGLTVTPRTWRDLAKLATEAIAAAARR